MIAARWSQEARLVNDTLVATVMSNLGLERFLNARGVRLHRTKVGDRYVVEAMRAHGYNLGGEQSGHIVMTDYATTGDGLMAGWNGLIVSLNALVVAVGFVLPWAAIAGAVVLVVWLVRRARARRRDDADPLP